MAEGTKNQQHANFTDISQDRELLRYEEECGADAVNAARLFRLVDFMETGELNEELLEACPELASMQVRIEKLKYRKGILEKSLTNQLVLNKANGAKNAGVDNNNADYGVVKKTRTEVKEKTGCTYHKYTKKVDYITVNDYGSSIMGRLNDLFKKSIHDAFPTVDVAVMLTEATNAKFGDYQCNSAMAISSKLKASGVNKRPYEVAKEISSKLSPNDLIEKTDVVPAGFINVFLNRSFIEKQIAVIAAKGIYLPKVESKKVLVDFSSPNIAKEMHVGHLRSTIIGDSICRLLECMGFNVLRINHIGDWGTQFGMLIAHLYDEYPNFLSQPPPICDLQAFYKESKKRFDTDADFKRRAYDCVVKLQSYEPEFVKAWTMICDISKKYNRGVYDRLDITINDKGESFYQDKMIQMVETLKQSHPDILREEDGRLVFFPSGCDVPLTVVKSDGGYTYDTSDMAALKYRLFEDKCDWIIYVVDAGQSLHLETVFAAARDLGWYDESEKRIEHVAFGLVLGEDKKKFKTRSGETVRLLDLLDEGTKRASEKLQEKGRHEVMSKAELVAARDAVAYGCIKYADLSHTRTQDYVFSFDRMLDDRGNTAVYLLYAYARIRSIIRTTGVSSESLNEFIAVLPSVPLLHPAELKLAKQILKLSDCVLQVLDSLMLHQLCDYLYQLSTIFHDFYSACYVIEKKNDDTTIHFHRLVLCEVTANVMSTCFKILGITEVAKM